MQGVAAFGNQEKYRDRVNAEYRKMTQMQRYGLVPAVSSAKHQKKAKRKRRINEGRSVGSADDISNYSDYVRQFDRLQNLYEQAHNRVSKLGCASQVDPKDDQPAKCYFSLFQRSINPQKASETDYVSGTLVPKPKGLDR